MVKRGHHRRRHGTILPLLAICMIGLFGFIGLAVDLGLLAVSRTQSQNAADTAALSACRILDKKPTSVNSNLPAAVAAGKDRATSNRYMSQNFATAQISKIEAGQYLYDPAAELFRVATWTDVTNNQSATPAAGGSWTAIRVTLALNQPTYFMRIFGVNGMPTGAKATAVFKPRDIAFVLDMTGSMGYGSTFNINNRSLNPDNMVPTFGHYINAATGNGGGSTVLRATENQVSGYAYPLNNYCVATRSGPPIVRDFYYDPTNEANPKTTTPTLTLSGGAPNLKNAFHRWSPPESGGNSSTATPVTYNFAGYNANTAATPAPYSYGTMTDSAGLVYSGDRWRRADGSINKTDTTWTGATNRAAFSVADLLGYTIASNQIGGVNLTKFRDPTWEQYGYDLNITGYRTAKSSSTTPLEPGTYGTGTGHQVAAADKFQGYSMGPGYWGKTFFIWPPDPRTPVADPGQTGYVAGDWRLRFFHRNNGTTWGTNYDTQGNSPTTGVNSSLLSTGSGTVLATGTANWIVDYPAVLKWIKSGPQTLPPNLRAGHVVYYTSIPDDVDSSTGSTEERLDKVWWKRYIDYVLSYNRNDGGDLYGVADSWTASGGNRTVNSTSDMESWTGPSTLWPNRKPYMSYRDSPNRPRLHFWFGPLSMLDFISPNGYKGSNWLPGTSHEAQCWQLKAGMNSVLEDVKNNRPNNYAGLVYFASSYNNIRRPMGQKFESLKNGLFYPKSLLDTIDLDNGGTSITTEKRPYDVNWNSVGADEIPSSGNSTDPVTGLAYAFNLLSSSTSLPAQYGSATNKGRRGAGKLVIFETDGVPNYTRSFTPTLAGYNTFYPTGSGGGSASASSAGNAAVAVTAQLVKQMSNTGGGDSGMSLPNAPARVYPIAFGDLFDTSMPTGATAQRVAALEFLADVAAEGNTGAAGASTIASQQIITGPYQDRIDTLRLCMENIFQSGVGVSLVE